jgi:hypothetical protein
MAGTIQKITESHTLTYSRDFSSLFDRESFDDDSKDFSGDSSGDSLGMEFDLRGGEDEFEIEDILSDAPELQSEAVIPLESAPVLLIEESSVMKNRAVSSDPKSSPCQINGIKDRDKRLKPGEMQIPPRRGLAQLVEELIGSPILQDPVVRKAVKHSTNESQSSHIFPVTRSSRQSTAPAHVRPKARSLKTLKPKADWICPDSWMPNHVCDSFCFEALSSF